MTAPLTTVRRPAGVAAFVAASVALVALALAAIWAAPYVPATDMPAHLYGAVARAHLDAGADGGRDYARFLVGNRPHTANGVLDLFAALEPSLGWRDAYRATASALVLLWMLGAGALVLAVDRRRAWLALLAASTAFGWSFYAGFFSFASATALGFLVVAQALRFDGRLASRAVLALLLFAAALAHFFAAFLAGVVWLAVAIARAPAGQRAREAAWTCACGLPAAAVGVAVTLSATDALVDPNEVLPLSLRLAAWGEATIGGPLWRQAPLLAAMLASLVAAVALRERTRVDRALVAVAAVFLAVPLVVPWSAAGWQHLSPRPLPLAAVLLCAAVPLERLSARARAIVAVACVSAAVATTLWAARLHLRASEDLADVLAAVEEPLPHPAGYRWPFVLVQPEFVDDASLFRWDPLRGVGNLFGITQGGFPAYAFVSSPANDVVLLRDEARAALPPPLLRSRLVTPVRRLEGAERRAAIEVLASYAVQVDGVILVERPEDHAIWKERGYVVDVERGRVLLARFQGCALDVTGATGDVRTRPALEGAAATTTLQRTDEVRGDARLERLPCGLLEVEGCGATRTVRLAPESVARIDCGP